MNWGRFWLDTRYDFWLDYHGLSGKQRRALRAELRANLDEATADRGWTAARSGIGSVRHLAKQNADDLGNPTRMAVNAGLMAASAVFGLVVVFVMWTMFAFADGVMATEIAPGRSVSAPVTLLPGSSFTAERPVGGGIAFGAHVSPWLLVLPPVLAFLVFARPWRLAGRGGHS